MTSSAPLDSGNTYTERLTLSRGQGCYWPHYRQEEGKMSFGSWLVMMSNYEQRVVDRYEDGDIIVDTASVNDGDKEYETAVAHPDYNDGWFMIVEAYDTIGGAQDGHNRWVAKMTTEPLPAVIVECQNAEIAKLIDIADLTFERKRKDVNLEERETA
jgi:hypothetical protein